MNIRFLHFAAHTARNGTCFPEPFFFFLSASSHTPQRSQRRPGHFRVREAMAGATGRSLENCWEDLDVFCCQCVGRRVPVHVKPQQLAADPASENSVAWRKAVRRRLAHGIGNTTAVEESFSVSMTCRQLQLSVFLFFIFEASLSWRVVTRTWRA